MSQIIFPRLYNVKTMLYNCTTAHLDFYSSDLKAGSTLAYLNVQVLPNIHFKDFTIEFHAKGDFNYGASKEGNVYFANYVPGQRSIIELNMKKLINLRSCHSENEEIGIDKMNVLFIDKMSCTLPWLIGKSEYISKIYKSFKIIDFSLERVCESQEDFAEFRAMALEHIDFKSAKKCERNIWKFSSLYTQSYGNKDVLHGTMITITMPSDEVEISEEVRLYTAANFIADFGGYLGLLLGASVISFVDVILHACQKYRNNN